MGTPPLQQTGTRPRPLARWRPLCPGERLSTTTEKNKTAAAPNHKHNKLRQPHRKQKTPPPPKSQAHSLTQTHTHPQPHTHTGPRLAQAQRVLKVAKSRQGTGTSTLGTLSREQQLRDTLGNRDKPPRPALTAPGKGWNNAPGQDRTMLSHWQGNGRRGEGGTGGEEKGTGCKSSTRARVPTPPPAPCTHPHPLASKEPQILPWAKP